MSYFLWIKAFHVVAVVSWMVGLFYLPRLFVYHSQIKSGQAHRVMFKTMERRLYFAIMYPAMMATWISGLILVFLLADNAAWLWVKLVVVLALTGFHFLLGHHLYQFAEDRNRLPHGYFRLINEIPTVGLIGVVIMVIVKPF